MSYTDFMLDRRSVVVLATLVCVAVVVQATGPTHARKRRSKRYGYLQLECNTEGAEVFVDSQPVGQVPLGRRLRLGAGKHTVKITKQGFTQFLDVIKVRPRRTTRLEIDLLPMAGVLKVTANVAEALVHVDGQFVGTTPLETRCWSVGAPFGSARPDITT